MEIADATRISKQVSDIYAARCGINRDDFWYLAKMQEELGELTAVYLSQTGRGRDRGEPPEALAHELADLFAQLLLFADHNGIDVPRALMSKWGRYLPAQADG